MKDILDKEEIDDLLFDDKSSLIIIKDFIEHSFILVFEIVEQVFEVNF